MNSSLRGSVAASDRPSLLMKINESVRTPTFATRPTPISPSADFAQRIGVSANTPIRELSCPELERPLVSKSEGADVGDLRQTSARSSISLPPLTPKKAPVPLEVSLPSDMHDNFTEREIALVNELNAFRKSPHHYAEKMRLFMEIHEPFVSHRRMTYPELLVFVAEKAEEKASLEKKLEDLGAKEKDEKGLLQSRWALEDVERAKRNKKTAMAAAGKKRGSTVIDEQEQVQSERAAAIDEVTSRYEAIKVHATATLSAVSADLFRASHGAKFVGICLRKIASTPPLPELKYGRGLSLAARDASEMGASAIEQASVLAKRYGSGVAYGIAQYIGVESASQTVMEMLLARNDPTFSGRQALLNPQFDSCGSGWRNNADGVATSTIVLSSLFEDLKAVSDRPHIPLTQLKHELPNAVRETPGTVIGLHGGFGISMVEPRHHPMSCGNVARIVLFCPEDVQVCGVVSHVSDDDPKWPTLGDGRSFAHRLDTNHVELLAVLPFRGDFAVTLFASKASFSSGFTRVGRVLIASYAWKPVESAITLPIPTGDFSKRNCRLISPMSGILSAFATHTFEIVIPFSNYLKDELSVIESELVAIGNKNEHSGASLEELELASAEAQRHYSAVEAQCTKQLQIIDEGIQALVKEAVRKRGKETKSKNVQAELEEQRKAEEQQLLAAGKALAEANQRVEAYRRSARQISAQQKRLGSEREDLLSAMDRSRPLLVEIGVGDRRAAMKPVAGTNNTRYILTMRCPKEGRVCLYVNGLLQLTWVVGDV